jgi:exodeoxyribonuclease VII small subunit
MSEKKRSIAEKTAELDELVSWFDGDDFELEQALEKFKEAEKLAQEIEKDLAALKNDINVVKARFDEAA